MYLNSKLKDSYPKVIVANPAFLIFKGALYMPAQNMPHWHICYFDLKAIEEQQQTKKELSALLLKAGHKGDINFHL